MPMVGSGSIRNWGEVVEGYGAQRMGVSTKLVWREFWKLMGLERWGNNVLSNIT